MTEATCLSIESPDGELLPTNGKSGTRDYTSTDTVPATKRLLLTIDQLKTVLTGLSKLIEKLDTSSSENNPTGIALLAHSTTPAPLNTLLKT